MISYTTALLLLDPPIRERKLAFSFKENGDKFVKQSKQDCPYQGGYRDFMPWPDTRTFRFSKSTIEGPRRVSLAEDITYYWLHAATDKQLGLALKTPYESTIFLRRIIISMLNSTLRQYYAGLSQLETKLWSMGRIIDPDLTYEQKNEYLGDFIGVMNEINKIRRRMNWCFYDMQTNSEVLNLTSSKPDTFRLPYRDEDRDFLVIRDQFLDYRKWAEKLLDITTTYLALMEAEKSASDSRSLSRLTILGSLFVPVSFVCSFFSMNGDFAVGANKFWVYFAVTLPLVIAILVVVFRGWWYRRLREASTASYRRVRLGLGDDNRAAMGEKLDVSKGEQGIIPV